MTKLIKFSSQAEKKALDALKKKAQRNGRKLHNVLNEAIKNYLELESIEKQRADVIAAYKDSVRKFDAAYKRLAK